MPTSKYPEERMSCGQCEVAIHGAGGRVSKVNDIDAIPQAGKLAEVISQLIDDASVLAAVDETSNKAVRMS